ncbi:hypothetical protein [Chitinophaga silvisoli]|uniref:hypothetical protein n=1 Tax=Chitinophaga silvisoli TaxID=2291814 RepID=UPI0011C0E2EC|nr:hypothetical protein [Chitinophaga silvisoli]
MGSNIYFGGYAFREIGLLVSGRYALRFQEVTTPDSGNTKLVSGDTTSVSGDTTPVSGKYAFRQEKSGSKVKFRHSPKISETKYCITNF